MGINRRRLVCKAVLLSTVVIAAWPALAADVTSDRLINADKEPQNWLMNHRTYDGQRFSPLDQINKTTSRTSSSPMRSRSAAPAVNENLEATPLVEDGFMYMVDLWGIVYKIDVRSGNAGRIVWRMNPKQEKAPIANRGVALWGSYVISGASYPPRIIATDKDTGKVVWETNLSTDQPEVQITAAPLAVKDKIIVGAAGGDRGVRDFIGGARCRDRQAAVAQIHHSGARRARQRDLEGQEQCLADRRRGGVGHRHLRRRTPTRRSGAPATRCR